MELLTVFADGACSGNPGPGAWAFVILNKHNEIIEQSSGVCENTTNNQMELMAVIELLKKHNSNINFFIDSKYVKDGITSWIHTWKANGWKNSQKKTVKNQELWMALDALNNSSVHWNWIKGHNNNLHDLANDLAQNTLKNYMNNK